MKKFVTKSLTYVAGLLMAVALVGCSVGGTGNTGTTTAPTAEQQNSAAVPPEAASKLHLKDGDTFPDFKATDITTGATYDNTVFGQNKVTVLTF